MAIPVSAPRGLDLAQAKQKAKALLEEIQQGKAFLRAGQRILTDRRFQLGQLLSEVRTRFPPSGRGASGWGRFLKELGLKRGTAARYIEIAEQVAQRPELAERRTFQEIYEELGLNAPPPQDRIAPVTAANVRPSPTSIPVLSSVDAEAPSAEDEDEDDTRDAPHGRPPLSEDERRSDIYMVRCNTDETLRLRRLSGLLALRDAEVFREGLLALEERERAKAAPLHQRPAPPVRDALRKGR